MTKLIENEQLKIALFNVDKYKDFEEYKKYNNYDYEEFQRYIENGYITDITLGLYNGATGTFLRNDINDKHIIDAIFTDLHNRDFYNFGSDQEWYDEKVEYKDSDWIREYTEYFDIFVINDRIYIEEF